MNDSQVSKTPDATARSMVARFVLAFSVLAALAITNYLLEWREARALHSDAAVVNLAGRQRMLTQRAGLQTERLIRAQGAAERPAIRKELREIAALLKSSHEALITGDESLGIVGHPSPEQRRLYFDPPVSLNAQMHAFFSELGDLSVVSDADLSPSNPHVDAVLSIVLAPRLLESLDQAVHQYQTESEGRSARIQRIQSWTVGSTLVVLLVTGIFLFLPMARRVRNEMRKLSDAETHSRAIVETALDGIIIIDEHGTIELFNPAAEKVFRYAASDVIGRNVSILVPELHASRHDGYLKHYLATGQSTVVGSGREVAGRRKDGAVFPARAAVNEMNIGGRRLFVGVVQDISAFKDAEARLKSLNETLEQRVAERTAAAQERARQLESEVQKRTAVEEALRESERTYRDIFEHSVEGLFQSTADGWILTANPAMAVIYGYDSPEEMMAAVHDIGSQLYADPRSRGRLIADVNEHGTVTHFEAQSRRKDGTVIWTSENVRVVRDENGKILRYEGSIVDITQRKVAEEALRESEARFRQMAESISGVVWIVDPETHEVIYVSKAYERIWRRARQSLYENPDSWIEAVHPDDRPRVVDAARRRDAEGTLSEEYRILTPDGEVRWIRDRGFPIRDASGRVCRVSGIADDVTEQRSLEAQFAQSQKLEAIGQLAAGIAHEINTPTQYVGDNMRFLRDSFDELSRLLLQYSKLLEAAKAGTVGDRLLEEVSEALHATDVDYLTDEIPRAIAQSLEGIGRIAKIVRAMKDFSHPGVQERGSVDLNHSIETTLTVAHNELKYVADIVTDFDPDLPSVPGHPNEINQMVLNILINAAGAIATALGENSESKGKITIRTRRVGEWAEIRIADTGMGIPERIRSRVFDPFFTTKEVGKGTGQGLALSHSIVVEKHRGTITFETEIGVGTTFIIRLPLQAPANEGR